MNRDQLLELCERGVALARSRGADQAEVMAAFGSGSSVDLEKNDLQIATSDEEVVYGVRVIRKGALGFATSNDPATLAETIDDALVIAASSVVDPHHDLPEPQSISPVADLYDPAIAALEVEDATALGHALIERARARDRRVSIDSGSVGFAVSRRALVNSRGIAVSEESTRISGSLFGMAVDGQQVSSFVSEGTMARRHDGFAKDLDAATDRFVEKVCGALYPKKGESYRGLVLFTPEAVESVLVDNLLTMMNPSTIRKGKSLIGTRLGSTIASTCFSLIDDGTARGRPGASSFDREGLPHRRMVLVDEGRFANIMYNTYETNAVGRPGGSTGNAAGNAATPPSVGTTELEVPGGRESLADILGRTDRVVIVTRFSGSSNAVTGDFSGVVKAGHLWRGGERIPISETLISGNLLEVLQNIATISSDRMRVFGHNQMPWILADGISVTAG